MKQCSNCKQTLPLSNYSKGKGTCKPCSSLITQARNKTPIGLVTMMYSNQRMTSRNMGRPLPNYTLKELFAWVTTQSNWISLFNAWVSSNYDKYLKPSCDRKDSGLPYTLANLQLVTFQDNLSNRSTEVRSGLNLGNNGTKVSQYTLDDVFIAEHASVNIAMRSLGKKISSSSNIHSVCKGTNKTAYGYKWKYS